MKDGHIIDLIDDGSAFEADAATRNMVESHAASCAECRSALTASRVAAELLRVRAEIEKPAPSPFFQTKVMAAIRERQNLRKPIAAFRRWWLASYPLVGSMLFIVATFAVLTLFAPRENATQTGATYNLYTTDSVILNQRPPRNLTTEQALEVIYTERRDSTKR